MNSLHKLARLRTYKHRTSLLRLSSTGPQYQEPHPATPRPNPHREFYRGGLGRAVAFNFLVAMATFQVLYWSWLKLESIEMKQQKGEELQSLEGQLKSLTEKGKQKVDEVAEDAKKDIKRKGWFG